MRYTADAGHCGIVTCDGQTISGVVEVDTELGFAIVNQRDECGEIIIEGGKPKHRLVLGEMTFTPTITPSVF